MMNFARNALVVFAIAATLPAGAALHAQQQADALPEAPMPATPLPRSASAAVSSSAPDDAQAQAAQGAAGSQAPAEHTDKQTSRILGIIPNFRAVSTSEHLPPQSVKEKFITATEDSFDYSSLAVPAVTAAVSYSRNAVPAFGSGGVGYGRYLWHTAVDQTIENYMVEFVWPSALREDTRYYTLGTGGFTKRAGYALSRVVVTRSDAGKPTFNGGEVFGAASGAALSNLYYPSSQRSVSNTSQQFAVSIIIDSIGFMVKEFWPDINHALFHGDKEYNSPQNPASKR